jgi:hypothetical protein
MVSGKYKLRILWGLQKGWRRYSEIKKGLLTGNVDSEEITPRVLSRELKTLLTMGMVERKDHRVFPRQSRIQTDPQRADSSADNRCYSRVGFAAIRGATSRELENVCLSPNV